MRANRPKPAKEAESYEHPDDKVLLRPDVGTQPQFKKKKPPKKYRYDDSLAPTMEWDGQNPAREQGEALIAAILDAKTLDEAKAAAAQLKGMSKPFLNWSGKAERLSFDVPTLPLFVHERLSTKAIIETLQSHKRDKQMSFDLFADPEHSVVDQVLHAYEFKDDWVNRMILGDSLVVMNSLLEYEGLGGQVQMIYMDPPYGVKFGSNFQPFVRKRDVKHGDDEDLTREPEMVKAYRDTWELGLHSYLSYLRDRLLLARELMSPSGSIFVQISDENLHHVREVMDEVFGAENLCSIIAFYKTSGQTTTLLPATKDFLLWYARDSTQVKFNRLFIPKKLDEVLDTAYDWTEDNAGVRRPISVDDRKQIDSLVERGHKVCALSALTSSGTVSTDQDFEFAGRRWRPPIGAHWKTTTGGMARLAEADRLGIKGNTLRYVRYFNDFPVFELTDIWNDVAFGGFVSAEKLYVVQTPTRVIERCVLMTTGPGDLVLDPTCGSGTTAHVAEQWGRRWITIDTSRVPLALARQRLLTATFPYYELRDEAKGPGGGFVYERKQNKKGEEVGGIVPHVTLKSIANNEPPDEEVLVDRPEVDNSWIRVTGPFCVEATIPTPTNWEGSGTSTPQPPSSSGAQSSPQEEGGFLDRMIEVLRKSPVLHLDGGKTVRLERVRAIAKSLSLSAEAYVEGSAVKDYATLADVVAEADEANGKALPLSQQPVAILFGPENGAISEGIVYEAWKEANARSFTHLYVIGFAIQEKARQSIEGFAQMGMGATYVQATMDLLMGDLLKNMRSSQIFSVCGLPDVEVRKRPGSKTPKISFPTEYEVELKGLDVFDPVEMTTEHRAGIDVPAWFLDTDYNGLCFHVSQAFFPRTGAWESLKKALRATHEESVWDHLAGAVSAPFEPGEHGQIAVKVIDDRGNELLVVKTLSEAKS